MKNTKISVLVSAIMFFVAGITFIASPISALGITLRIVGAAILVWEFVKIYALFKAVGSDKIPLVSIITNQFFTIICATIILISPVKALRILSVVMGIYLLVTAGIAIFHQLGGMKRGFSETAITVVSLMVGIWLVISPIDISRILSICIGVALILKGIDTLWDCIRDDDYDSDDYISDDFEDKSDDV